MGLEDLTIGEISTIVGLLVGYAGIVATWTLTKKRVSDHEKSLGKIKNKLENRLERIHRVESRVDILDTLEGKVEQDVEKIDKKVDEKVEKLDEKYQSVGERVGMVWHVIYPHLSANEGSVLTSLRDIVTSHAASGNPIKKSELDKFNEYREKVANKTLTEDEYEDFKKLSKEIEDDLPPGEDKEKFGSLIQDALGFAAGVTFWSLSIPFGSKKKGKKND